MLRLASPGGIRFLPQPYLIKLVCVTNALRNGAFMSSQTTVDQSSRALLWAECLGLFFAAPVGLYFFAAPPGPPGNTPGHRGRRILRLVSAQGARLRSSGHMAGAGAAQAPKGNAFGPGPAAAALGPGQLPVRSGQIPGHAQHPSPRLAHACAALPYPGRLSPGGGVPGIFSSSATAPCSRTPE